VPDARVIDSLSYNEAMELAYFGAKVIHPQTMAPAVSATIPIWIRNTFAPEAPLHADRAYRPTTAAAGQGHHAIEVALVNLEGAGMIGVPGTAHRLFGALREARRVGHPDLAGQFRALDLLRRARAPWRTRAERWSSARSRTSWAGQIQASA
jgi:hypothetical protein